MKQFFRKSLSLLLTLAMLAALTLPAAASEALGSELIGREITLNEETRLTTNVFWSSAYSDLRTENVVTYTPNEKVTPIVTFGDVLGGTSTVSSVAQQLEKEGYRVVAGFNGDFYNVNTGLPIGIVVTEGELRSSDAGCYAVGFRKDGSAVLGKPAVKTTMTRERDDGSGDLTNMTRNIAGINKVRVSDGGIFLYTYDFNARHTTGTTEDGVSVVCSITDGEMAIGGHMILRVEQVIEGSAPVSIGKDQVVLSANAKSGVYFVDILRSLQKYERVDLHFNVENEAWEDVEYAVGALYSLVENGAVVSGLPTTAGPRTAIGQREDGSLVFYTIDGRKTGHSIGANMTQVAKRMIELGCVTAVGLDGGGSTTLSVTAPSDTESAVINRPSEGSERAVSTQIFLVADAAPSNRLSHFYVNADSSYVLAGSTVEIQASAVDSNYIPMNRSYDLWASAGTLEGNILTTPVEGGDITVTAEGSGRQGMTTVYAITQPDSVAIHGSNGAQLLTLNVTPGSSTELVAAAEYSHLPLKADPGCFVWEVTGGIGTVDENGVFHASAPGVGTISVTAGGKTASIDVRVSRMPLKTLEDFESETTIFDGKLPRNAAISRTETESLVKLGRGALKFDYALAEDENYVMTSRIFTETPLNSVYTTMNLWIYGDGSFNTLNVLYHSAAEGDLVQFVTALDFVGWQQFTIDLWSATELQGFEVNGGVAFTYQDASGTIITEYPTALHESTIYIDQLVSSFVGTVDNEPPAITLTEQDGVVTARIMDTVDGVLSPYAVGVHYDGEPLDFRYDETTGTAAADLPESDGAAHRVTVTAKDASGNIGRASFDRPAGEEWVHIFADTQDHWSANYVDYLYTAGITGGYEDGTFRPHQNISRAQFAVMLYRYLGLEESDYETVELTFADADAIPAYAVTAVKALYSMGVLGGSAGPDGKLYFYPGNSLTRAQASAMIGRTQEKGYASAELTFTDKAAIPEYASAYISTMAAQGVLGGYEDSTFRPGNFITRGQMAKILYNLM